MARLLSDSTIDGNIIWHDGATNSREACLVYQTSAQSITNSLWTQINFQTVKFDKLGGWSGGTDVTQQKYTIQKGGIYLVIGSVNWRNTNTVAIRTLLELDINGLSYAWITQEHSAVASQDFSTRGSIVVECAVGDILKTTVFQQGPAPMDTSIIGNPVNISTFFNITKIA